jgi:hypothetical protein
MLVGEEKGKVGWRSEGGRGEKKGRGGEWEW